MMTSVLLASISQVLLKKSANSVFSQKWRYFLNFRTTSAYGLFFLTTLINIFCLKYIPLMTAGMIETSAYVYILILDRLFFKQKITIRKIIGNSLIVLGIVICLLR
ncbi:MAG: EamA family transporter [Akkermansia sp.]